MRTILTVVLAVGAAGCLLLAQQTPAQIDLERLANQLKGQDKQIRLRLNNQELQFVAGQLVSGALVKGAPYAAEAVTESTQTLSDGNRIVKRSSSKQYRDSEGRERKEETSAMGAIFITDPVAQVSYTLHPDSQTAEKTAGLGNRAVVSYYTTVNPAAPGTDAGGGRGGRGVYGVSIGAPGTVSLNGQQLVIINPPNPNAKVEQLPAIQIEGVQAQGTRTTTTIPVGQIGNERPINVVDERWYSPDLQMTVMTKHTDPREGETVFKLTNIQRIEQVRSLFEVPSNYTVNETPGLGGRGARGGGLGAGAAPAGGGGRGGRGAPPAPAVPPAQK